MDGYYKGERLGRRETSWAGFEASEDSTRHAITLEPWLDLAFLDMGDSIARARMFAGVSGQAIVELVTKRYQLNLIGDRATVPNFAVDFNFLARLGLQIELVGMFPIEYNLKVSHEGSLEHAVSIGYSF